MTSDEVHMPRQRRMREKKKPEKEDSNHGPSLCV